MTCQIRALRLEDAPHLAQALNNKNIHDKLRDGLPLPYTVTDAQAYIQAVLNAEPGAVYAYAITVDDKAIGNIAVSRKENIHFRTAELGYYIAQPYWGKGLGTSAVQQVCSLIFETTDIVRIFAEPFSHNLASCRILEKSGFVLEGVLRKNAVKNGKVLDMNLYALVN